MNALTVAEFRERFVRRVRQQTRVFDRRRVASVFSQRGETDALGRIYVINLDRRPDRWRRVRRELDRFRGRHGERLTALSRRVSAVDARYMRSAPDPAMLRPDYTLADQLTVDPNALLEIDDTTRAHKIEMSRQEIAVALSHIETWRRVASGNDPVALILEDDVLLSWGFAPRLQATWAAVQAPDTNLDVELLYLAYKDVGRAKHAPSDRPIVRRLEPGLWEAAAYVLTKAGAQKLLDQLPAFGPIDLWLNFQFAHVKAFTAGRPLIEQRIDEPSTNSYSVLPVLSQVGIITREKALVPTARKLRGPVIGLGPSCSGLTSLAKALSMVGYTCLSDLDQAPAGELGKLRRGARDRLFNAYVNIGSIDTEMVREIAAANPRARFVLTSPDWALADLPTDQILHLDPNVSDKWASLSEFLGIEYPAFTYPETDDLGQRSRALRPMLDAPLPAADLKFDTSPWILSQRPAGWRGIAVQLERPVDGSTTSIKWSFGEQLEDKVWRVRNDTFPSNLALFSPNNVGTDADGLALTMRRERTPVRDFTGAAVSSRARYLYGSFAAELRPPNVPGLITGLFLHRNGPRQEIDIEFLGRDTTRMLVNVFYNPGLNGTKLEYGYRGTPTEIELGFDAAEDFHLYEIEWLPDCITWRVDGEAVFERPLWNPSPIPDRPLEFNINLWHSRSAEFAGRLDPSRLPTRATVRSIVITAACEP